MASPTLQKKEGRQKEKIMEERRIFNEKQIKDYFVEAISKALSLICRDFVRIFKDYNLKGIVKKTTTKFKPCSGGSSL